MITGITGANGNRRDSPNNTSNKNTANNKTRERTKDKIKKMGRS